MGRATHNYPQFTSNSSVAGLRWNHPTPGSTPHHDTPPLSRPQPDTVKYDLSHAFAFHPPTPSNKFRMDELNVKNEDGSETVINTSATEMESAGTSDMWRSPMTVTTPTSQSQSQSQNFTSTSLNSVAPNLNGYHHHQQQQHQQQQQQQQQQQHSQQRGKLLRSKTRSAIASCLSKASRLVKFRRSQPHQSRQQETESGVFPSAMDQDHHSNSNNNSNNDNNEHRDRFYLGNTNANANAHDAAPDMRHAYIAQDDIFNSLNNNLNFARQHHGMEHTGNNQSSWQTSNGPNTNANHYRASGTFMSSQGAADPWTGHNNSAVNNGGDFCFGGNNNNNNNGSISNLFEMSDASPFSFGGQQNNNDGTGVSHITEVDRDPSSDPQFDHQLMNSATNLQDESDMSRLITGLLSLQQQQQQQQLDGYSNATTSKPNQSSGGGDTFPMLSMDTSLLASLPIDNNNYNSSINQCNTPSFFSHNTPMSTSCSLSPSLSLSPSPSTGALSPGGVTADGKPFMCPHPGCGKCFSHSTNLRRHMRSHSGLRPYTCTYSNCNKRFARRSDLTTHVRTHTGERPYVCRECAKTFTTCSNLRRHEKTHRRKGTSKQPSRA